MAISHSDETPTGASMLKIVEAKRESAHPKFVHRFDSEETGYVSFCRTCFQNVAIEKDEAALAAAEAAHVCRGPIRKSNLPNVA